MEWKAGLKMSDFVKERNAALFSLDEQKIRQYSEKYGGHIPENKEVFWAGVYKAILAITDAPDDLKALAGTWLDSHGFQRTIF